MSEDLNDTIIYYLCGFVCKRMSEETKCYHCKSAFKSHPEFSIFPIAELTNKRTNGKLIYPSQYIFTLFSRMDKIFQMNIHKLDIVFLIQF